MGPYPTLPLLALTKLLIYAGTALLIGGVVARRSVTPLHPALLWPGLSSVLILGGTALNVALPLRTLGFTAPADVLNYLTSTGSGRAGLTLALGALLLLDAEVSGWPRPLLVGAAAVTLWRLAGTRHGGTHGPTVRLLHAVHARAMGGWIGGVLALLTLRRAGPHDAQRFTPVATGCVGVLGVTGVFASWEHAGGLGAVLNTPYGWTLLLKLAVVLLTLAAAVLSAARLPGNGASGATSRWRSRCWWRCSASRRPSRPRRPQCRGCPAWPFSLLRLHSRNHAPFPSGQAWPACCSSVSERGGGGVPRPSPAAPSTGVDTGGRWRETGGVRRGRGLTSHKD